MFPDNCNVPLPFLIRPPLPAILFDQVSNEHSAASQLRSLVVPISYFIPWPILTVKSPFPKVLARLSRSSPKFCFTSSASMFFTSSAEANIAGPLMAFSRSIFPQPKYLSITLARPSVTLPFSSISAAVVFKTETVWLELI